MKFRIWFSLPDGSEDNVIVEGASVEEIRQKADQEVVKRGGIDPWSEELR